MRAAFLSWRRWRIANERRQYAAAMVVLAHRQGRAL